MTNPKPYGFIYQDKILRKWQNGHQTLIAENCPGEGWHQARLFAWDIDGHKVVEFEKVEIIEEVK